MLQALERGVEGGRWYCLIDKVIRPENLRAAWRTVRKNRGAAGVDHQAVKDFEKRLEENLERLHQDLRTGRYRPQAVRRVRIPKPGRPGETRPLGIPTVRDRVVQGAVRNVLEPIFEAEFAEHSYGFRPGRGTKDALRRVKPLIDAGYTHVVDADLKGYFDSIPHDRLLESVKRRVTDGPVLGLLALFLTQEVEEDGTRSTPERGTPQGGVISPLLANIYLSPLDHRMAERGFEMVRYADDFVILCRSAEAATAALDLVGTWTAQADLVLHPEKTRIAHLDDGGWFDFLGYRFTRTHHHVGPKAMARMKDHVRELTPRLSGNNLTHVVKRLNAVLMGWFEYYKHTRSGALQTIDQFTRGRLRAILWRRTRTGGYPPRSVNWRWPIAYFERLGLFSLERARNAVLATRRAVRPPTGEPCA